MPNGLKRRLESLYIDINKVTIVNRLPLYGMIIIMANGSLWVVEEKEYLKLKEQAE